MWFVPLAPVRDALDVPQAVLSALGIAGDGLARGPGETVRLTVLPPLDRLTDALAGPAAACWCWTTAST